MCSLIGVCLCKYRAYIFRIEHLDCSNSVEIIKIYLRALTDEHYSLLAVLSVNARLDIILKPIV